MIDTRLIILEGLPSTGKSTNSQFLQIQLERNRKNVKWIHEVAHPHPVLFLDGWDIPLDKYEEVAVEKLEHFTETAPQNKDNVYILDSSIFQYQIFRFLLSNAPYIKLESFVRKLFAVIQPLNPCMIYLYRENTEKTIDYLEQDRGTKSLENIWERDKSNPYYQDKPAGAEGFKQFLRDYANYAKLLFDSLDCRKISVEISQSDWTSYENQMLSFLEIKNMPSPAFFPPNGVYRNEELNYEMIVDGLMITDPDGNKKKLISKTANEFYAERLPMILRFENQSIMMSGSQINAPWSTTGMIYKKVRNNAMITYRKATINDIAGLAKIRSIMLAEIIGECSEKEREQIESNNKIYFQTALADDSFVAWIALDGDNIVATSGLSFYVVPPALVEGKVAYIMNMFTLPEYRNQGIGTELFKRIVEEAKKRGYKIIKLNATDMVRPLYEKYGFVDSHGEMIFKE